MRGNLVHAKIADIVERRAERDGPGDVGRACFELEGQIVVGGLGKGDGADHVAAALVRRHGVEQRALAVEHADAGGPVNLMAAEGVEVAIERLHIDGEVRNGLCSVDEDGDAVAVGQLDHLAQRSHRPQRV